MVLLLAWGTAALKRISKAGWRAVRMVGHACSRATSDNIKATEQAGKCCKKKL